MNTKNQKEVLEGFQNRIDKLGSRKAALQTLSGQQLMDLINALAATLPAPKPTHNPELN